MIVQRDIGSAQQVKSPKYLISAHQTQFKVNAPDEINIIAIFDNLDLRKYFVEIDGRRYPRQNVLLNYEENDYIEQNRDIKSFFKEFFGELILSLLISYPDIKTKNSIGRIDLGHQLDHVTPKTIQQFQENGCHPDNARIVFNNN